MATKKDTTEPLTPAPATTPATTPTPAASTSDATSPPALAATIATPAPSDAERRMVASVMLALAVDTIDEIPEALDTLQREGRLTAAEGERLKHELDDARREIVGLGEDLVRARSDVNEARKRVDEANRSLLKDPPTNPADIESLVKRFVDTAEKEGIPLAARGVLQTEARRFFQMLARIAGGENPEPAVLSAPPNIKPQENTPAAAADKQNPPPPGVVAGEAAAFDVGRTVETKDDKGVVVNIEKIAPKDNIHGGIDVVFAGFDGAQVGAHPNKHGNVVLKAGRQINGVMPGEIFGEPPARAYELAKKGHATLMIPGQLVSLSPSR